MRYAAYVLVAALWACGGAEDDATIPAHDQMSQELAGVRRTMETQPNSPVLHFQIGQVFERYGMKDSALAAYDRSVLLHEAFPEAHQRRADLHFQRQELAMAAAAYEQASRFAPGDASIHNNRGFIYRQMGRLADAASAYEEALRCDSAFVEAINNLGQVHRESGDTTAAIDAFRRALVVDESFRQAYINLTSTLKESGQVEAERAVLELMVTRFGASSREGGYAAARLAELGDV